MNKIKELNDWLDANPNKTDRDWLLEVRCKGEQQREDLKKLFAWIDEANSNPDERKHVKLNICPYPLTVTGLHTMPEGSHPGVDAPGWGEPLENVDIFFDFRIDNFYYDLETPEHIYDFQANPRDLTSTLRTLKYFEWKAKQFNMDNSNFANHTSETLKQYQGTKAFPPHWKILPDLYSNK